MGHLSRGLVIAGLVFLTYGCATKSDLSFEESEVNKSYDYLSDYVNKSEYNEIDVYKAEMHIGVLTSFMEKYPLTPEEEVVLRHARAKALYAVNTVRFVNGEDVNDQQEGIAVEDIQFVVKNNSNPDKALIYYRDAGQITSHLTDNKVLAFNYYVKCAELGGGACQNVVAHGLFNGKFDVPINIKRSMYWHARAYQTQLNYGCAGIYSSNILVHLSYHFPDLSDENWKEWLKRKNTLTEQLGNSFRRKYCGFNSEDYFSEYVLYKLKGEENTQLLQLAISSSKSSLQQKMYQAILENNDLDSAYRFFQREISTSEELLCESARDLLLLSKRDNRSRITKQLEYYFSEVKPSKCRFSRSLLKQIKDKKM